MSDENQKRIEEGLRKAIQAEHEGRYFYLMAADTTSDPQGKEVFTRLAREEQEHFEFLSNQLEAIRKTGKADAALKLSTPVDLKGISPIFSESLKKRIGEAHYEMTALSVAAQLELDASKFYKEQAELVDDLILKTFYLGLAEWETGHYRALIMQQETLKEDYWSAGGFAPF